MGVKPRSVRVASVVPECAWSARRICWIMSHEVRLSPTRCIIARCSRLPWRPSLMMKEIAYPAAGGAGLACFRSRRTIGLPALSDARSGCPRWDHYLVTDQWLRSILPGAALRAAQGKEDLDHPLRAGGIPVIGAACPVPGPGTARLPGTPAGTHPPGWPASWVLLRVEQAAGPPPSRSREPPPRRAPSRR
jgi:hypothetical protein